MRGQAVAAIADPVALESEITLTCLDNGVDYAEASARAHARKNRALMEAGVCLVSPDQTRIEAGVTIAAGVRIEPNTHIQGKTVIEAGAVIGTGSVIKNARIEAGAEIRPYCVLDDCRIGPNAAVGPFAHIRPGSDLGPDVKVGNFVETKKAVLGEGSKAGHLSYLGDTRIGRDCNIGAGTITCNYDGFNKHQTVLGDGVFIGSDSQLVAPVTLGDGSFVAAGSSITGDVPAEGLAVARAKQVVKEGRAKIIRDRARALKQSRS